MESINLTNEQRLYLQAILDYFREFGKWPILKHLEGQFLRTHPDLDIEEIAQSLPDGLTHHVDFWNPESKVVLTIPGIYKCWGLVPELSSFLNILEICTDLYFNSGGETRTLSSADLARDNPTWRDIAIRKVGLLLLSEPHIWSTASGPGIEGDWSITIAKSIRRYRGVKTIEQYLEKRELSRKVMIRPVPPIIEEQVVEPTPTDDLQLHPDIKSKSWDLYLAEKYDDAILNATKALEVAIRTKAKLPQSCVGIDVINTAFSLKKPLLLYSKVDAEQEGMMSLLRGIIQVFKNPQSHRFVGVQSKSECLGVLLMCSNLLYVVDTTAYVGTS